MNRKGKGSVASRPIEVKKRYRETILSLPNVVGLGIGAKIVNGQPTNTVAIKVYVHSKIPEQHLTEGQCIPKKLDGIPTDVEELATPRAS